MGGFEVLWDVITRRPETFGIAGAIVFATIGYIAKHLFDLRLRRYEERMRFTTAQLRDLYGPLFLLSQANDKTWKDFRTYFRPNRRMFNDEDPLTEEEKAEYVLWLETAFVPCNAKMREVIENNAHLFKDGSAPPVILALLSHFSDLDVVLAKMKIGSSKNVFPSAPYPGEFAVDMKNEYNAIVQRYTQLASKWR